MKIYGMKKLFILAFLAVSLPVFARVTLTTSKGIYYDTGSTMSMVHFWIQENHLLFGIYWTSDFNKFCSNLKKAGVRMYDEQINHGLSSPCFVKVYKEDIQEAIDYGDYEPGILRFYVKNRDTE